jgi:tetrapyrrole methylase family protein/MazG family protein
MSSEHFSRLKEIIATLRSPEGCPWDRKQTHNSLLPFLFEEAYETGDALLSGDMNHLKEELGDLLLQIMLHSEIAGEEGHFTIEDVIALLNEKLVRRHPHVFSNENAESADDVVVLWEDIKRQEKKDTHFNSVLERVPRHMPPLKRAQKLQKYAAKTGFDWKDWRGPLSKVKEEIHELEQEIAQATGKDGSKELMSSERVSDELGDIFFSLVNLARALGHDAESSLVKSNFKFYNRFTFIEQRVAESGRSIEDFTLEELDSLWDEAKKLER